MNYNAVVSGATPGAGNRTFLASRAICRDVAGAAEEMAMNIELSTERTKAQYGFVKMMTSEMRRREHPVQMSSKPAIVCLDTDRWQDVIADVAREGSELIGVATTGLPKREMEFRLLNCASGISRHIPGQVEEVPVHQDAEVKMVVSLIDSAAASGVAVVVVPASVDDDLAPLEVQSVEVARP